MRITTVSFDLTKWRSYEQGIIQPYTHGILSEVVAPKNPERFLYRGGFGRHEDFERLLATGCDREDGWVYASPINRVAKVPWRRGHDPLYWALRGHRNGKWNPVRAIVAYRPDRLTNYADQYKVGEDAVEAILLLHLSIPQRARDRIFDLRLTLQTKRDRRRDRKRLEKLLKV